MSALGLPVRCVNSLKRQGISTIDQLVAWSAAELQFEIRGLGRVSVEQIEEALAEYGLSLAARAPRVAYNTRPTPPSGIDNVVNGWT